MRHSPVRLQKTRKSPPSSAVGHPLQLCSVQLCRCVRATPDDHGITIHEVFYVNREFFFCRQILAKKKNAILDATVF